MFKWLRNRIELLKNDKQLLLVMVLHIVLIGLHVYEWQVGDIEYYWYLRAGGCGLIAYQIHEARIRRRKTERNTSK